MALRSEDSSAFLTESGSTLNADGYDDLLYVHPQLRIFLAEITAYDPGSSSQIVYRFSDQIGFDSSGTFYAPRIEQPASMRRDIQSALLGGRQTSSYGELTLINTDGALDDLAGDYFDGRSLVLKTGYNDIAYGSFTTILSATIETVAFEEDRISIRIKDRSAALDVPFSTVQYAGTNALPAGIEGTGDDIKGQYKPRVFGHIALMTPIMVNTSKLIYQVNDGAVDCIANVFDAGAYLSRGTDYTGQADMENNQPSAGTFRSWPAGGCFRIGSSPYGQISCCVIEKWTHTQVSAAGIVLRILQEIGWTGSDYVSADFTTLDQFCCGPIGIISDGGETIASLISKICETVGAWWGFDSLNRFRIGRLNAPGSPVATLTVDDILSIERQPESQLPVWKITVPGDKNWSVQDRKSLAGSVPEARAAWLSSETRDSKAENSSVKAQRLLAEEQKADPVFYSAISQAQAEATRRIGLLGTRRDLVTVTLPDPFSWSAIDIGATVTVSCSYFGYGSGRTMVVVGMAPNYHRNILDLTLWG